MIPLVFLKGDIALDIETTGVEHHDVIVSASIAWREPEHLSSDSFWLDPLCQDSLRERQAFKSFLDATLFNPSYEGSILFHNANFDLVRIWSEFGCGKRFSSKLICKIADTLTLSRVASNNKFVAHTDPKKRLCHSLKYLASEHLGIDHSDFLDVTGGMNIRLVKRDSLLEYNRKDAEITLHLYEHFKKQMSTHEWGYCERIEVPHLLNQLHMNTGGVTYDIKGALEYLKSLIKHRDLLETDIHIAAGRTFNISSQQELASALFYNPHLMYQEDGALIPIKPLYLTSQGQPKTDLETLSELEKRLKEKPLSDESRAFLKKVMEYLEASKAVSMLESHVQYARPDAKSHKIYPNFSAEAKSGRLKSVRPNLLGVPKSIFKKSGASDQRSLRDLLTAPNDYDVWSIDINALDLTVIAHAASKFNPDFPWVRLFKMSVDHNIDIHMAISSAMDYARYEKILSPVADRLKNPLREYIPLKHDKERSITPFLHSSGKVEEIIFSAHEDELKKAIEDSRTLSKVINLSTAYGMGPSTLAQRLSKDIGSHCTKDDAQDKLRSFYEAFPEIRLFQDEISNHVYQNGYADSIFGRRYYADVFDEINGYQNSLTSVSDGLFEFVVCIKSRYWYIKARHWKKDPQNAFENRKLIDPPFGFTFADILIIEELDKSIFKKSEKQKASRFNRKKEQQSEEVHKYGLTRIQITNCIDHHLKDGWSLSSDAEASLSSLLRDGDYFIPESKILFFRVLLPKPSSKYFRIYKSLSQCADKFFPLFCQGTAATVATLCLTKVREEIESKNLDAQILLFVHDQIDVMVHKSQSEQMRAILKAAVEEPKPPFSVQVTGNLKGPSRTIR